MRHLALLVLVAVPARAAVVLPQTTESLTRQATAVVRGVIVSQQQGVDAAAHRSILETTIRVLEAYKGGPLETATVRQLGRAGKGGRPVLIEGDAKLAPGEEVVLFLKAGRGAEAGYWFLLGFGQGKLTVRRDGAGVPRVERDLSGLSFRKGKPAAAPTTLAALEAVVRKVAAESK